jgi:hypothetical protein
VHLTLLAFVDVRLQLEVHCKRATVAGKIETPFANVAKEVSI